MVIQEYIIKLSVVKKKNLWNGGKKKLNAKSKTRAELPGKMALISEVDITSNPCGQPEEEAHLSDDEGRKNNGQEEG
jgi:hypothetical protein